MKVIREIREINSDEIIIKVPKEFKRKKVEIILLPIEELEDEEIFSKGDKKKGTKGKVKKRGAGKLNQNWAGSLKEFKQQFKSIELQKKALDWRS